ncbi:hypothetical protein SAMN02982917_6032 [Azospirillum oryzae]|uniref:Immunity MXAN-0049 protein domain-containing protein n=1 Tax=Azospirillum oryzae TaxID=286727 RepID=A0A1X7HIS0_9PROT|nr:DUF1629 domain-containing protein [Azospirillum oryzae]SMF86690.1 hypothetical protein SAMN02982917_6032 [Azospirillum oryzae]
MPYILEGNINDKSGVRVEFEPEVDERVRACLSIDPSEEDLAAVPREMTIAKPRIPKVPEIIQWGGGRYFFCERLRAMVEEMEPSVHRSVPVAVRTREPFHGTTEHGVWHLMVPPPRIPALVIEETEFWQGFGREAYDRGDRFLAVDKKAPCVLDGAVIAGRHLWRLPREFKTDWFYSDELWDRMKAEKMKGLAITKFCTIRKNH